MANGSTTAMVVCMSRRICVDLFDELIKLRPDWDDPDFGKGAVKVILELVNLAKEFREALDRGEALGADSG